MIKVVKSLIINWFWICGFFLFIFSVNYEIIISSISIFDVVDL